MRNYGADIVRTTLAFRGQTVENTKLDEAELEQTRKWFQSISKGSDSAS
jgi:leucyl-tRNA synthetase